MNNRFNDDEEEASCSELRAVGYTAMSIIGLILFSILTISCVVKIASV